jgi:hypothetical protein
MPVELYETTTCRRGREEGETDSACAQMRKQNEDSYSCTVQTENVNYVGLSSLTQEVINVKITEHNAGDRSCDDAACTQQEAVEKVELAFRSPTEQHRQQRGHEPDDNRLNLQ